MFGTISPKEIEEGLQKQWGITIDRRESSSTSIRPTPLATPV
jgi:ribosomal protein L9